MPNNIFEIESLLQFRQEKSDFSDCIIQSINFEGENLNWESINVSGTVFLGCTFPSPALEIKLRGRGAIIFPKIDGIPYNPYRQSLYSWQELNKQAEPSSISYDELIYNHFSSKRKKTPDIMECLAQRIHDHAIDDALEEFLKIHSHNDPSKIVGVMGGHSTKRTDPNYRRVVETTYYLAQSGYLVVSGGGPGIMEAANLGAYLANYHPSDLEIAINILKEAPHYTDSNFMDQAFKVIEKYPKGNSNIAVPTWFYGHEPSNLFATVIAKYFSNSIREDGLLAICIGGIIYAPGSAGTTQEVFQDAAQNHYCTFNYFSPMVFLGTDYFVNQSQIYPTLQNLAKGKEYAQLLFLTDEPKEVSNFLKNNPPISVVN